MKEFLENFRIEKYRFVTTPHEVIRLSPYAGSSLRRDFIPALKQVSCTEPHGECDDCSQQEGCVFYMAMKYKIPDVEDKYLKRFQTPPKPFVFEPPLARKTLYTKNENLVFDLLLVGKLIESFPSFVAAFRRLGDQGMGKNQGKFTINKVLRVNLLEANKVDELAVDSQHSFNKQKDNSVSLTQLYEHFQLKENNVTQVQVSFLTPLRMKRAGSETWHLSFRIFMRSLLTRISNLGYSYCDYPEFYNFSDLIYEAGAIKTVREDLAWEDWREQRRNKGNGPSKLGGYRGDIVYQGRLATFWPWLKLAEVLHVGKNCSFGLGRVVVEAKS